MSRSPPLHTQQPSCAVASRDHLNYDRVFAAAHAAVPDFAAGAMENWGLVLYRETALLYDEMTSSAENKQNVAIVISHELAHMVTPRTRCMGTGHKLMATPALVNK